jgi:hypothetical protein
MLTRQRSNKPRRSGKKATRPSQTAVAERRVVERLDHQLTSSLPVTRDIDLLRVKRNKPYTLVGNYQATITGSSSVEYDSAFTFYLSQIANYSQLVACFDSYRFLQVRAMFVPATSNTGSSPIWTVIDYDDNNATVISSLLQYDTLQIAPAGAYFERVLRPRCSIAMYSGTFTSFANSEPQWIDCNSASVNHYGIKTGVTASPNPPTWYVSFEYTIQFRNIR